ncbi:DUF7373 family lipoprotein [Nocardia suismassiliense]|uniref:DUF7373 family lipoprotein n=1 Tax=Nocardia suismassiliense TaxID=2077092 RepID=UPI00131F43E4|nr:hypothetical protein [Nocardia suismassiliense]
MNWNPRAVTAIVVVLAAVVGAGGCASTVHGTGISSEIDVRSLDTGKFPTTPAKVPARLDDVGYARLEAARMADAVLSPHEVDPTYSAGASALMHTDVQSVTRYLAEPTIPVLLNHGFVLGFSTGSAEDVLPLTTAAAGSRQREGLTVTVLRLRDAAAAKAAAAELDAVDFALNPENVAVSLPKYPDSRAHWRPSVPTLGSTTAHGIYVISVLADSRTADINRLVEATQKYLDAEVAELDKFTPTPVGNFSTLHQDPDGLLARVMHDQGVVAGPDGQGEVVLTLRGYLNYVLDQSGRLPVLRRAGVDRVAVAPSAFGFRTADDAAAARFVAESAELGNPVDRRAVDPPADVPGALCVQDYVAPKEAQFRCFVAYRRYVALVLGARLWETQQRAAAQYAVLANAQR